MGNYIRCLNFKACFLMEYQMYLYVDSMHAKDLTFGQHLPRGQFYKSDLAILKILLFRHFTDKNLPKRWQNSKIFQFFAYKMPMKCPKSKIFKIAKSDLQNYLQGRYKPNFKFLAYSLSAKRYILCDFQKQEKMAFKSRFKFFSSLFPQFQPTCTIEPLISKFLCMCTCFMTKITLQELC